MWSILAEREGQAKRASPASLAPYFDRSAVRQHNLLHQKETQTIATLNGSVGTAVELLEDSFLFRSRDTDSLILDFQHRMRSLLSKTDRDVLSPVAILGRIVEQIQNHFGKRRGIEPDTRQVSGQIDLYRESCSP